MIWRDKLTGSTLASTAPPIGVLYSFLVFPGCSINGPPNKYTVVIQTSSVELLRTLNIKKHMCQGAEMQNVRVRPIVNIGIIAIPDTLYMSEPFGRNIQCIGFYCSGESTSPVYGSESGRACV